MTAEAASLELALASGAAAEQLVPCDVEGLTDLAFALRDHASVLEDASGSLGRIEVTSWRGEASARFADAISVEPGRWLTAADGFVAGAVAIEGFVSGVPAARDKARTAADLYRQYLTLVAQATAGQALELPDNGSGTGRDRMTIGARIDQLTQATGEQAVVAHQADTARRQAIALLGAARAAIAASGEVAARALDRAAAEAPDARRFWHSNIRPSDLEGVAHAALDVAGFVPGPIGITASVANAAWYAAEGDVQNAGWSAAAVVPGLKLAKGAKGVVAGGRVAGDLLRATDQIESSGGIARTVRLSAGAGGMTKWGLTETHLDKHFAGPGALSLKQIDPGGDDVKWLEDLRSLAGRPVDRVFSNGVQQIIGTVSRADGTGTFTLGIRLSPCPDGSFDLVTVLTRQ